MSLLRPSSASKYMLLFIAMVSLASCDRRTPPGPSPPPVGPNTTLAKIGSEAYTQSQFNSFLEERFPETTNPVPRNNEVLSGLLDEAINERLLLQAAREAKVEVSDRDVQEYQANSAMIQNSREAKQDIKDPQGQRERAREILMVNRYLQALGASSPTVSLAEEKAYYDAHSEAFQEPERYHVEEILVKDEPLAEAIEQMLAKHRPFKTLAQKYSKNPVASQGGDLGWFARGELPEQLEKAVTGLKPGAHSAIVKTDYGYHIFKLKAIQKGRRIPFEQARQQIQILLGDLRKREVIDQEISKLRKEIPVVIENRNLGFSYISNIQKQ